MKNIFYLYWVSNKKTTFKVGFEVEIVASVNEWYFVTHLFFPSAYCIYKIQTSEYIPFRYTRNLVDQGNGKFNLMILCWGEGHGR